MNLEICYLLLFPFKNSSTLGPTLSVAAPKDAPYFYDLDIEFRSSWGEREVTVEGVRVRVKLQVLDELVWVAECRYHLSDALADLRIGYKRAIHTGLKQKLFAETESMDPLIEEYTIILRRENETDPDAFVEQYAAQLGRFLRSLPKTLSRSDALEILSARSHFSERDLTVVDWSGAIIIAEDGDCQADIELLKIGKYQLLRYRMLDQTIQQKLQQVRGNLSSLRLKWLPSSNKILQEIVAQRLALLLDFEKIDQSLLLIGDWYSAQVYQLIVDRFSLDEWKALVSTRLDNLAAIDSVVRENLTFSWQRAIDLIMLVGWLILLVGYFYLFLADL